MADSLQLTTVQNAFELLSHHVQSDFVVGNVSADISMSPEVIICSDSGAEVSRTWYLRDEEPAFTNEDKHELLFFLETKLSSHSRTKKVFKAR